jgi:hypothetical protein
MTRTTLRAAACLAFSLTLAARAAGEEVIRLTKDQDASGRLTRQERPFAFVTDPSTPSAGVATLEYRLGFASGMDAERPLPADLTSAGGSHSFGFAYGLTSRWAPFASVTLHGEGRKANVLAGAKVLLGNPSAPLQVSIAAAGLREAGGAYGLQVLGAASYDAGPLRIAGNVQGEKIFEQGRDELDLLVMAGASWRVGSAVRLGAEYVGQDLEALYEDEEAEGGARHLIGPSMSLDLDRGRYQLAVAGGFGLTRETPAALARAQLAVSF